MLTHVPIQGNIRKPTLYNTVLHSPALDLQLHDMHYELQNASDLPRKIEYHHTRKIAIRACLINLSSSSVTVYVLLSWFRSGQLSWLVAASREANVIPANSTPVPCIAVHPAAGYLVLHRTHTGQFQFQRQCYGKMLTPLPCSSAVPLGRCA